MIDVIIPRTPNDEHPGRVGYESEKWATRTFGDFGSVRAMKEYKMNDKGRHPFNILTEETIK